MSAKHNGLNSISSKFSLELQGSKCWLPRWNPHFIAWRPWRRTNRHLEAVNSRFKPSSLQGLLYMEWSYFDWKSSGRKLSGTDAILGMFHARGTIIVPSLAVRARPWDPHLNSDKIIGLNTFQLFGGEASIKASWNLIILLAIRQQSCHIWFKNKHYLRNRTRWV